MSENINLLDFNNKSIRTLHLTWIAFFISFIVWFSHAPLLVFIKESFDLSSEQIKVLMILNVAITIPSRIVIGTLVDKFGPRHVYSGLLIISSFLCFAFASANSYEQLALTRFLLGFVGAGFVIGIRMVGEWFPAKTVGVAEGIYGGWGNFGSAAGAMALPTIAYFFGAFDSIAEKDAWRWAIACTGIVAFFYGIFYFIVARNTPKGSTYFKPKKHGGMEVTSRFDYYFYIGMCVPMYLALSVLVWKLSPANLALLTETTSIVMYAGLFALFIFQVNRIHHVNEDMLRDGIPENQRYKFKQVAILDISYFVTFGSELAVVSMLPLFFLETFAELTPVKAGLLASGFAFMNLAARPGGGWMSDKFGRKKSLSILIAGLTIGYFVLSQIGSGWWIPAAVIATMSCSFFVQAGEGAVFAMVPLVQRRMTGQIAGMAGAYGNVGGVIYLTILSFVDYSTFFMVIGASAAFVWIFVHFLDEPKGHMTEVLPDGTVQLIEVS